MSTVRKCVISLGAVGIALAALISGFYVEFNRSSPVGDDLDALVGLKTHIELPSNELLREVTISDDGITPVKAVSDEVDGEITVYKFWNDGKLKEAVTYFPPIKTGGLATMIRRHARFKQDGFTYLSDTEYYSSGELLKSMKLDDTTGVATLVLYYDGPGLKVKSTELFLPEENRKFLWKKMKMTRFFESGVVAEDFVADKNYAYTKRFFDAEGNLLQTQVMKEWKADFTDTVFWDDHVTPRRVVLQTSRNTVVRLFNKAGKKYEERTWYGAIATAMMNVKIFDASETLVLEQNFDRFQESEKGESHYVPYGIYVRDGSETRFSISYFFRSGGLLQSVTDYHVPYKLGHRTVYSNDREGNLVEIAVYDGQKDPVKKTVFAVSEQKKLANHFKIDPDWLRQRPYEMPAQVIPYSPPGPYY